MPRLFGDAVTRALDADSQPVSAAELRVYEAGTTTAVTTYSDQALTTAQAVPVVADSSGVFAPIYVDAGSYKVDVTDPDTGASLPGYPVDYVETSAGVSSGEVRPEAYGAAGDGVTDDTSALQAWIDAIEANGYIGAGSPGATYKITSGLTVDASDVALIGNGATFDFRRTDADIISVVGTRASRLSNIEVSGWNVIFADGLSTLVYVRGATDVRVENNTGTGGRLYRSDLTSDSAGETNPAQQLGLTGASDVFTIGETVTGGTSGATATVRKAGTGFTDLTSITGTFSDGETLTGGTSGETATVSGLGDLRSDIDQVVVGDLVQRLRIRGNRFTGGSTAASTTRRSFSLVDLEWVDDAEVSGNVLLDDRNGVKWHGGDANPDRDGGVGSTRWASNLRIFNNRVKGMSLGGLWGAQGREISVYGNNVENCLDICIHGEGDLNATYSGNAARNGKNGCYTPYFVCENTAYVGNVGIMDDDTYADDFGKMVVCKHNYGQANIQFTILFSGNSFEMADRTHEYLGVVEFQAGATITFEGNNLKNCVIEGGRTATAANLSNVGARLIRNNTFLIDYDPGVEVTIITLGPNLPQAKFEIKDNYVSILSTLDLNDDGGRFVRLYSAGTYGCAVTNNQVDRLEIFAVTECLTSTGSAHTTIFSHNIGAAERRYIDVTDGVTVGATLSRHFFDSEMIGDTAFQLIPLWDATPTGAVSGPSINLAARGSKFQYNDAAAGGEIMSICVSPGGVSTGTWSNGGGSEAGGDYTLGITVTGSNSKVYRCKTQVGSGSNDPATDADVSHWLEIASAAAIFRDAGDINA